MILSSAAHRKIAAEYRARANVALTVLEQDDLLRMAQEHLLLAGANPAMMPPRRFPSGS